MDRAERERLRALAAGACLPWRTEEGVDYPAVPCWDILAEGQVATAREEQDARLIVAAVNALPGLIQALHAAEKRAEEAEAALRLEYGEGPGEEQRDALFAALERWRVDSPSGGGGG